MPSIDMPLDQLRLYKPTLYREADFEQFWETTIAEAVGQPLNAELIPYDLPARRLQCYAVRFDGYQGGRLAGWYVRPDARGKFPGLCIYHGYNNRGSRPIEMLHLAAQGMCVLSLDTRGQLGQSQDVNAYPEGHFHGSMTQGIREAKTYFYRYVYADAVRALELLAHRDEVDAKRLAVTGLSQGGGMALAVAALSDRPALCLPDIPFLCDFRRAIQMAQTSAYLEIPTFLKAYPHLYDTVMQTLSYVDNLNLAPWIKCRTVMSIGLWDECCAPSTGFGVYNQITAEKQIEIYPFHKHEVVLPHQETKFRILTEALGL